MVVHGAYVYIIMNRRKTTSRPVKRLLKRYVHERKTRWAGHISASANTQTCPKKSIDAGVD